MTSRKIPYTKLPSVLAYALATLLLAQATACTSPSLGQDDDDDETPPGLLAVYRAVGAETKTSTDKNGVAPVTRIDRSLSFHWGDSSPDQRLPAGPFHAHWSGSVLIRQATSYRFHTFACGTVKITIDGQTVLAVDQAATAQQDATWSVGNVIELPVGERRIEIEYESLPNTDARLSVFWSSDVFELEPVPGHLLYRQDHAPKLNLIERGKQQFTQYRCGRCHQRPNQLLSAPGPDLRRLDVDATWLTNWIQSSGSKVTPNGVSQVTSMPHYDFSAEQATDVAAFLIQQSKRQKLSKISTPKAPKTNEPDGKRLLHSVGCLACHSYNGVGNTPSASESKDLSSIGDKRSKPWIAAWLKDPKSLNSDHQMPVFKLNDTQRARLAIFLSESHSADHAAAQQAKATASDMKIGDPNNGRKLVAQAGCVNCHQIEGLRSTYESLTDLSRTPDWSKSCLTAPKQRAGNHSTNPQRTDLQPEYPQANHSAIRAFVESQTGELSKQSSFEHGRSILTQKHCIACHDRDHQRGISAIAAKITKADKRLRGQSQGLIPPALTAVGDKLLDNALAEAVSGAQQKPRLPWLSVQMPRFEHSAADKAALSQFLIDHDRIPANAPGDRVHVAVEDDQRQLAGHTLVGPRGFSCVACHKVGTFEPKKVALGTRGSDLMMIGKRMRPQFFTRWVRSPIRIVPGMEMPSFTKPVAGVLDGDIHQQLGVTWDALNDPEFVPPSDPSVVEQFLVVQPDSAPQIVRDVFTHRTTGPTNKKTKTGYIPRSFAVGFHNGHSLLFDLDSFAVRDWRIGDFATQRTEGKSWYWDMAGIPLADGFDLPSDLALQLPDKTLVFPTERDGMTGRLDSYSHHGKYGVQLWYTVYFQNGQNQVDVQIEEVITPFGGTPGSGNGLRRTITRRSDQHTVYLVRPKITSRLGNATTSLAGTWQTHSIGNDQYQITALTKNSAKSLPPVSIDYLATVERPPTDIKPRPVAKSEGGNITTVPGFVGTRLPITPSIMPTAMTWTTDGVLAFTSLKGTVYLARDTDGDGIEDSLTVFEQGLAAPFGIIADGNDLIVAHKPEVIRLTDTDGDGKADKRSVVATGWGYTDNYHDWTTGIVRDSNNNLYVGISSDYAQKNRPKNKAKWRGDVLRISAEGQVEPVGHSFRYPIGLAINGKDQVFVSDNQGVQNTFNEINLLQNDAYYGVPSRHETNPDAANTKPAIRVPHPWSRSVNGLTILNDASSANELLGHGIGCEYDYHFLIRFTTQTVGDTVQGATYYFSKPNQPSGGHNFVGPINAAVSPTGEIYIASIYDSGWLGGLNTGAITRLKRDGNSPDDYPLGIRELRAISDGFELEFTGPIDKSAATNADQYSISGYTRTWSGNYASDDSGRYRVTIKSIQVSADRKTVRLHVDRIKPDFVYEVTCGKINPNDPDKPLWPATGHYSMHRIPQNDKPLK